MKSLPLSLTLLAGLILSSPATASGTLTAQGAAEQPIQILDHHVDVVINNGFARVEVAQVFFNPNGIDLEAIYSFPVPESASLAEMSIQTGEVEIQGEVVEKTKARETYEKERDDGNDTGLAEKQSYVNYEVAVSPVRAQSEARCRFVYYQPLAIDTGVGRFVYPLEDGGTDEAALAFWTTNTRVERSFSMALELKSTWPVEALRLPGLDAVTQIERLGEGHLRARLDLNDASLDRDLVVYYKLAEDLPGRIEVIPYRADPNGPGTFMMVVTPGIDLQPLASGSDYVFVLDTSGSMASKLHTLARGVAAGLGKLNPRDRFKIISFNSSATLLTRGWVSAEPALVDATIDMLSNLSSSGSTNLFDGVAMALNDLDADRATSIVLVTDAVANQGVVSPAAFHKLMSQYDVRVFGFLMGNGANWPLMRTLCDASGGFYAGVSNADDIVGQILLAKSKITHEALHDAKLQISGVKVFERTSEHVGKVYRGQQLVVFGRYDQPGEATISLRAKLTGEDKTYSARFHFPESATEHPELERLWAMNRVEQIQAQIDRGETPKSEGRQAIIDYGVDYQIVTEHTSMLVLTDEAFERHGIERRNRDRVAIERQAQTLRASHPPRNHRVDRDQPAFGGKAPRGGGGAVDPVLLALFAAITLIAIGSATSKRRPAVR